MLRLFKIAFVATALFTTACSNQWRESDPDINDADVVEIMDEMITNSGSGGFVGTASLQDLREDPASTIYFAESGPAMGVPESVFSFADVSFLGNLFGESFYGRNVFELGLNYVAAVLLDATTSTSGERVFTLMLKFESAYGDQPQYRTYQSDYYTFEDDRFEAQMPFGSNEALIIRSFDVSTQYGEELAGNIHLEVSVLDSAGEFAAGQISVMHGFGGAQ